MVKKNNKFREKLFKKTDFQKIKTIPKYLNKSWGKGKFVMPSPLEVNILMKKVPKGKFKPPKIVIIFGSRFFAKYENLYASSKFQLKLEKQSIVGDFLSKALAK